MSARDLMERGVGRVVEAIIWAVIFVVGISLPLSMKIRNSVPGIWGRIGVAAWCFLVVGLASAIAAKGIMYTGSIVYGNVKNKFRRKLEDWP